jgi:hypothetical protein
MRPDLPIALGAGLIAAIVFASATTGPTLARMVLLALVTLPIALAGYAYGARAAFVAAASGIALIALLTTVAAGAAFALTLALPAAFLVYLALLHRDMPDGTVEWYPVGRVVLAAAVLGASVVALGLYMTGDIDKLRAAIRSAVDAMMKSGFGSMPNGMPLSEADLAKVTDIMLQILPSLSAAFWMGCILFCQWLAARVALMSGQLTRPWPDLAAITFPHGTSLLLAGALAAALLLDGTGRLVAMGYAGAFYAAYVALGLAVLHFNSRGYSWRGGALAVLYAVLLVFNSGASLLIALIGLTDSFVPLRRLPDGPVPPQSSSQSNR